MEFVTWVFQDWSSNQSRLDSQIILAWFRLVQYLQKNLPFLGHLANVPYRIVVSTFIGVELPATLTIGPRIKLYHPHNIVIHHDTVIGTDCLIRHGVTIGTKLKEDGVESRPPILHDNIELGASCILVGDIEISSNCVIGAGAVVTKSLPDGSVAVGNPFRLSH
jgi:putative colanic acid biosynthesis acetyltransferase WcaB